MKRNQWIRLAVFLISFAFFLSLPVYQYWMLKYNKGCDITLPVTFQSDDDPCRLSFVCVETTAAAGKDATDLGRGYVYFDLSKDVAHFAGVAAERKMVPGNTPFLILRDLKLTPDGKSYLVPLILRYFAEDPAEAANLRLKIIKAKSIKLKLAVYPNGDYLVKEIDLD